MMLRGARGPSVVALVALWVAMAAVTACGDDDDGGEAEADQTRETGEIEPVRRHQIDKMTPHEIAAAPSRSGGRVARLDGVARRDGQPLAVGDRFGPGELLETDEGAHVALDLVREVRVEIGAEAEVRRGSVGEAQLFLHRGTLRGTLPPVGGGSRPPLRVGTASGTVVLAGAGDVLIAALPSGDTWVAVFSGAAVLSRGDFQGEAGERRTEGTRVLEGHAALLGRAAVAEPTEAPERVDSGWAAAQQLIEAAPRAPGANLEGLAEAAGARFDEAAAWLVAERTLGVTLADQQRTLMDSDPEGARELTRDIVAHSQRLIRLKVIVLGRYEQAAAAAGVADGEISPQRAALAREHLVDH
ncbi:MAG: hypothetical protein JRH11_11960 [Deltaproteobacteria bacterium]|nr:hypothetical protein [Deltaproteobacteria bacterium]